MKPTPSNHPNLIHRQWNSKPYSKFNSDHYILISFTTLNGKICSKAKHCSRCVFLISFLPVLAIHGILGLYPGWVSIIRAEGKCGKQWTTEIRSIIASRKKRSCLWHIVYFQWGIATVRIVSNIHIKMVYLNSKNSHSKAQEITLKKKNQKRSHPFTTLAFYIPWEMLKLTTKNEIRKKVFSKLLSQSCTIVYNLHKCS